MKTKVFFAVVVAIVGAALLLIRGLDAKEIAAVTIFAIFIATMVVKVMDIMKDEEPKRYNNDFKYNKKLENK